MKKTIISGTGLLIIAAIIVAVNLLASVLFNNTKIDTTEDKLFTLSKGTKSMLSKVDQDVQAQIFFSRDASANYPAFRSYGERVLQMVREFSSYTGGKMTVEMFDPKPDTEIEELADSSGLRYAPSPDGGKMYLGLVLKGETPEPQYIPFFAQETEENLEYDIAKAIYRLTHPERKKVGVIAGLPIMGAPGNPTMGQQQQQSWVFVQELKSTYDVEEIQPDQATLPEGLDVLALIHPKNLSDGMQYAIDQYVMRGGHVIAFVDPFCETEQASMQQMGMQQRMQTDTASNLPRLFESWGIALESGQESTDVPTGKSDSKPEIVADPSLGIKARVSGGQVDDVIVWLGLTKDNCNKSEIVTNGLDNLMYIDGGAIKKVTNSNDITVTPLLTSTSKAGMVNDMMMRLGNVSQLKNEYKPDTTAKNLAVMITGKFKTAFPDGQPAAKDGAEKPKESTLAASEKPATIIVVADVDMISDSYSVQVSNFFGQNIVQTLNDNQRFAGNAVEFLTGSQELIALRSRGRSQRPFTRVKSLETAAQDRYREEEKGLEAKLDEANRRLTELERGEGGKNRVLDQAYAAEVKKFRDEQVGTRRKLREVRRILREDIETLGARVKFINIALLPIGITLASLILAMTKSLRRRVSA
jgi:ABC-type uncharacterized transport system involved in gliding motility auxiliary subunit